jgi:hypothetical protein
MLRPDHSYEELFPVHVQPRTVIENTPEAHAKDRDARRRKLEACRLLASSCAIIGNLRGNWCGMPWHWQAIRFAARCENSAATDCSTAVLFRGAAWLWGVLLLNGGWRDSRWALGRSMHALDFPGMMHGAKLGRNYRLAAVHLRYQISSVDDFVKRSGRRKPSYKMPHARPAVQLTLRIRSGFALPYL